MAAFCLSRAVYASEDLFEERLPVHWMWWPAIGGVVVGIGGLIFPTRPGHGYDVIASLIGGNTTWQFIAGVLIVKSIIWAFSLGSGTSGGILAPLLMIGGALGALVGFGLPLWRQGPGLWSVWLLFCLARSVAPLPRWSQHGTDPQLRAYAAAFAASVAAHAFTVLFQKRSILTERLSSPRLSSEP